MLEINLQNITNNIICLKYFKHFNKNFTIKIKLMYLKTRFRSIGTYNNNLIEFLLKCL